MSDISKVIEEEFDEEGRLTRRTVTEYGGDIKVLPAPTYVPPYIPYRWWDSGQVISYNDTKLREGHPFITT